MALRISDNENKYPAEVKEALAAERAAALVEDAERTVVEQERAATIVKGLQSKYGFSEAGAEATMRQIKRGFDWNGNAYVKSARFATPEMAEAAMKAYEYFWS